LSSELLKVAQMAQADALTIAAGLPGSALMQRAGDAVAHEIVRRFGRGSAAVLCGPGNNGGDGFVTAVALAEAGWEVRVALLGERTALQGDAAHHAKRWTGDLERLSAAVLEGATVVIDAVFGAGLNRPLPAAVSETLAIAVERRLPIVAVDVPSGVFGDTGAASSAAPAECTITFARKKPAHLLQPGRSLCGAVVVADIGITDATIVSLRVECWENEPSLWLPKLPLTDISANKYTRGHALLYGGYPMTGAARMAARAAARIGAGLTTIAVPQVAFDIYAASLTSIMVKPLEHQDDFPRLLSDRRYTAFSIGPGAGVNDTTRTGVLALLKLKRPVVLDADAISVFAPDPGELFSAIAGPVVMTPHDGEFKRIFDVTGDKLARARAAARISGCIIVLKGSDTVIASPDGRAIINGNAPSTLATAGAGDVLGGLILGLMAQGMEAFLAAAAGVWMHGAAAANFGPGLLAEDLPDLIPSVLRRLESRRVG
jgi:ADP-dependent NAD(P)H-hydrate dehydratase / NAD(P)H-hydrate epimerase